MTQAAWVHDLSPVVLPLFGDWAIRWYGLAYAAGFLIAYLLMRWLSARGACLIPRERVLDVILYGVVGVVVGGRLGYVLLYRPALLWTVDDQFPWWGVLEIQRGGMASHGGMAGVVIAGWLAARKLAREGVAASPSMPRRTGWLTLHLLDIFALLTPFGLFLGRLANFVNGELLGRIVALPGQPAPWWAVRFPHEHLPESGHAPPLSAEQAHALLRLVDSVRLQDQTFSQGYRRLMELIQHGRTDLADQLAPLLSARHPSQIYQALTEGLVLGAVLWLIARRPRVPGVVSGWFLTVYGVLRIITEIWRLPDPDIGRTLGLSRGQWLSVAMIVVGLVGLWMLWRRGEAPLGGWRRHHTTRPNRPASGLEPS